MDKILEKINLPYLKKYHSKETHDKWERITLTYNNEDIFHISKEYRYDSQSRVETGYIIRFKISPDEWGRRGFILGDVNTTPIHEQIISYITESKQYQNIIIKKHLNEFLK